MSKLSVVIPVYNEERTIKVILDKIFSVDIEKEVIVVDDGSLDSTAGILKSMSHPELRIFLKSKNEGKGSAVRYGIKKARGKYIIIQDADVEYFPDDYKKLLQPLESGQARAVYGNRFPLGGKNMFFRQKLANMFLTFLTNILYGGGVRDMETCYKILPAWLFKSLNLKEDNFDIEAEITAKLIKRKIKILNVPIKYSGRFYDEGKKINFRDALRAVWILLKYRINFI
jgi:glycosyltransferase involved in cell wall biosynthesis